MNTKTILAGLGGAIALNILHESLKRIDGDMPRIDKLGEEALQKGLEKAGTHIDDEDNLYAATLGGDLISNALYFSMIGAGNPKHIWPKAIAMGVIAGTGAIELAEPLGLDPDLVAKTNKTKSLTVGYYLFGALVTAGILQLTSTKKLY